MGWLRADQESWPGAAPPRESDTPPNQNGDSGRTRPTSAAASSPAKVTRWPCPGPPQNHDSCPSRPLVRPLSHDLTNTVGIVERKTGHTSKLPCAWGAIDHHPADADLVNVRRDRPPPRGVGARARVPLSQDTPLCRLAVASPSYRCAIIAISGKIRLTCPCEKNYYPYSHVGLPYPTWEKIALIFVD